METDDNFTITDDNFTIIEVDNNKEQYLPLLLIGDESESMIDRYVDSGTLYIGLFNDKPIARLRSCQS